MNKEERKNRAHKNPDKLQLFAFYVAMGKDRNLETVAKKFGLSIQRLKQISVSEKWQDRLADIFEKAKEELQQQFQDSVMINELFKRVMKKNALNRASALLVDTKSILSCKLAWEMAKTELGEPTKYEKLQHENPPQVILYLPDNRRDGNNPNSPADNNSPPADGLSGKSAE